MKKKSGEGTAINISTAELRKSLGEIFDRVQYSGSRYVVSRKGRQIGAIVPVDLAGKLELLEQGRMDALARLASMLDQKRDLAGSDDAAMDIANDLVDEVRRNAASR